MFQEFSEVESGLLQRFKSGIRAIACKLGRRDKCDNDDADGPPVMPMRPNRNVRRRQQ